MKNFNIFYIFHSSFVVESKENIFIFDFYKFPIADNNKKAKEKESFLKKYIERKDKKIFILSSHSHKDHFNEEILEWSKINEEIIYIFSDDIKKYNQKNIIYLKENDELKIQDIQFFIYGSTDLGVSFYIVINEQNNKKIIFHSGDFHLWHWEDDTLEEEKEMKENYLRILNKIKIDKSKNEKIDFAFIPVDPRLGLNTFEGVELFDEFLDPKYIIPMHFEEDYSAMLKLLQLDTVKEKVVKINQTMVKIF